VEFGFGAGLVELDVASGDDVGRGAWVAAADPGTDRDVGDVDAVLLEVVVKGISRTPGVLSGI
jgi:hypothetical protein